MIKFKVMGVPITKARPRFFRKGNYVGTYTDGKTKVAQDNFRAQAMPYRPMRPYKGALKLEVNFQMIKPKSYNRRVVFWTKKPDLDNLVKLVKDSMNQIFWEDDSQVVEMNIKKRYGEENFTEVTVEALEYEPEAEDIKGDRKHTIVEV